MDADPNAFDELTALFVSEHEPAPLELVGGEETEVAKDDSPMHLTVVICGHLPVMAGLWVSQYADRVGEENGPTGLLRLEGGRCSLELFRTPRDAARINQGSSLLDSLESMAGNLRRWVVCVDESDAAEAVRAGVNEVVVLTGADKPAVLAAYRIAKTVGARLRPDEDLRLGLVVVGADATRSDAVGEVLGVTAGEYMDRSLEVIDTIERMDVVESARRMLFAERERATPGESIALLRGLGPKASAVVEIKEPEPEPEPVASIDTQEEAEVDAPLRFIDAEPPVKQGNDVRLPPIVPPLMEEAIDLEVSTPTRERSVVIEPLPKPLSPAEEPAPTPAASKPVRRQSDQDGLCMRFPEFSPLEFRCPIAKSVELAIDMTGRLRLICPSDGLADARVASAWAKSNDALLRAAIPALRSDELDPVLDLVTTDAASVADLHRTGVRLYLLTLLEIEGKSKWVRVDLNSEESSQIP